MKKILSLLLAVLLLCAALPASADEAAPATWAVYIYMCGSDLESKDGCGTANLKTLIDNDLPENVTFVIQTGGSNAWKNDFVDPDHISRFVLANHGAGNELTPVGVLPQANMAEGETLKSFLQFAYTSYPADHIMLIIWDHGGGTLYGACIDEHYGPESMLVSDMAGACKAVFGTDPADPPLDIIAFDCCLMATVDVAAAFSDCAEYLIASEEVIPGGGWDYAALARAFVHDPGISPRTLGITICNDYMARYTAEGGSSIVTLAMIDLTKVHRLVLCCENLGLVILAAMYENPSLYRDFAITTLNTENYGGNSRVQGYTNLVDLYSFADEYAEQGVEEAQAVCEAVEDCVICHVSGPFRKNSHGLSFYFPYNGMTDEIEIYGREGALLSFKCLYSVVTGMPLSESEKLYIRENTALDPDAPPVIPSFKNVDTTHSGVQLNENRRIYVIFGPDVGSTVIQAVVNLFAVSESGALYYFGTDDEILCDFDNAVFTDNFSGQWFYVGGCLAYANLDYDGEDYHIYSIPIEIQETRYFLQRGYNYADRTWQDLGVRRISNEPGSARAFYLDPGTPFKLLQRVWDAESDDFVYITVADLEYDPDMFAFKALPNGYYGMEFRLEDSFRNTLFSERWYFTLRDGMLYYDGSY